MIKYQKKASKLFSSRLGDLQNHYSDQIEELQKKIDKGEDVKEPRRGGCTVEGTSKFYKHFESKGFVKVPKTGWMVSNLCYSSGNVILKTSAFNDGIQKSIRSGTNFIQVNLDDTYMNRYNDGYIYNNNNYYCVIVIQ